MTLALVLAAAVAAAPAPAKPAKPSFTAALEAFKKEPSATNREAVIKAARAAKPAVPEEARRAMVRGATFQKEAKDDADYAKAESAFREAADAAPWWSDAYHNLSVAQELRKDIPGAVASLRLHLLACSEAEKREAQDRLYALEAKAELLQSEADAKLIRPGVGIGRARVGMSEKELIAALGEPESRWLSRGMGWKSGLTAWLGDDGRAMSVGTEKEEYRTKGGLRRGSTRAQFRAEFGEPVHIYPRQTGATITGECYANFVAADFADEGERCISLSVSKGECPK